MAEIVKSVSNPGSTSNSKVEGLVTEALTPQFEEIITEDGILCLILSFLTMIEAVRTSVLSSRWRYIWTRLTILDFNAVSVLDARSLRDRHLSNLSTEEAYTLTKGRTNEFIQSVNSVLQQLKGARVDKFVVRHFLDKSHSHHLDEWVRFVVASETKHLRLRLFPLFFKQGEPYDFPAHLLGSSSFMEIFFLFLCSLKLPCEFNGLNRLQVLVLIDVNVSDEDLNRIVCNCSFTLKKLCVWDTPLLETISFPHPVSQLHTLYVRTCNLLRKLEINAENLLKLDYWGVPMDLRFRQSSKLNDAHIRFNAGGVVHNLDFYFTKLSSSLPHLRSLDLNICGIFNVADFPKDSRKFIHLRHLAWELDNKVKMIPLHLATLLSVAPFLEEMELHLSESVFEQPPQAPSNMEMLPRHPHTHLKTIQVSGFYFDKWQIEIVAYLLNNATELKSMMIKKGSNPSRSVSKEINEAGMEILHQGVPVNVKLVVS